MLKTDIYTYSNNRWVLFSGRMGDPDLDIDQAGSIYLHHEDQTHYDVVTMVSSRTTNLQQQSLAQNVESMIKYNTRLNNRQRMREKRNIIFKGQSEDSTKEVGKLRKSKRLLEKKTQYMNNEAFRSKTKETSKENYSVTKITGEI